MTALFRRAFTSHGQDLAHLLGGKRVGTTWTRWIRQQLPHRLAQPLGLVLQLDQSRAALEPALTP